MAPADKRLVWAGLTHPEWTRGSGGLDSYHAFSIHVSEVRAETLEPGDRAEPAGHSPAAGHGRAGIRGHSRATGRSRAGTPRALFKIPLK